MNNSNEEYDCNDVIELESVEDDTDHEVNDCCLKIFLIQLKMLNFLIQCLFNKYFNYINEYLFSNKYKY